MQDKTKNIIITIGFVSLLILVFFVNILVEDKQISITERRKLAGFPEFSISKLLKGETTSKFENYAVDQFVARDTFRSIKAFYSTNIYKQKDNNNFFEKDGAIYKIDYPLNEGNIKKSASKINEVYNTYLSNMNVYYAVIPDKNYYLENDDHLKCDYNLIKQIMNNELTDLKYIDIWDSLELEDYYKTDLHWRQEQLEGVVNTIRTSMNLDNLESKYVVCDMGNFYGTYYGQLSTNVMPDKMYVLINDAISNCTTYNYETQKTGKIYDETPSQDKYDIYLSGATPIISIENENATIDKELLLFRDSFGSSIAPLLVENYKKITLIDLRYISSKILDSYIEFKDQDVLFLYSTVVLNQNVLK
ncbi:MAG: hypothetical protein J6A29_01345 [Clostridia bacterium]|nr:hypothetical protein [Clostridia bacterium]